MERVTILEGSLVVLRDIQRRLRKIEQACTDPIISDELLCLAEAMKTVVGDLRKGV